jgi:hypothetical protein
VEQFEIYYSDLNEDAQERFLDYMGFDDPSEGNYDSDILPIAIVDIDREGDDVDLSEDEGFVVTVDFVLPEENLQDSTDEQGGSEVELLLDKAEYKRDHE